MTDVQRGIAVINDNGDIKAVVKCDGNGKGSLYMSFIAQEYLGDSRSGREVKVRFDGGEPYVVEARYGEQTAHIFNLVPGNVGARILQDMLQAQRMVIQLTKYNYDTVTTSFDLTDAAAVIKQAAFACGDTNWAS